MQKLCFIGDSHLAAIKSAWNDFAAGPGKDLHTDFFGSIASSLRKNLRPDGDFLKPGSDFLSEQFRKSSGGKTSIPVHDYEGFAIFGPDLSIKSLLRLTDSFALHRMETKNRNRLISKACLQAAALDMAGSSMAYQIVRDLRSLTSAPICVVLAPFPDEGWFRLPLSPEAKAPIERDPRLDELILEMHLYGHSELTRALGATLVQQPEETRSGLITTRGNFSVEPAYWLSQMNDHWHMNADYGRAVLSEVVLKLTQRPKLNPPAGDYPEIDPADSF